MLFAIMGFSNLSQAQSTTQSNWMALEESPKLIDISYRVMKCEDNQPKIHLHVFNENTTEQEVNFQLHLVDDAGNKGEIEAKGIKMKLAEMRNADCGSTDNTDLIFPIPSGINTENFKVTITYLD